MGQIQFTCLKCSTSDTVVTTTSLLNNNNNNNNYNNNNNKNNQSSIPDYSEDDNDVVIGMITPDGNMSSQSKNHHTLRIHQHNTKHFQSFSSDNHGSQDRGSPAQQQQ